MQRLWFRVLQGSASFWVHGQEWFRVQSLGQFQVHSGSFRAQVQGHVGFPVHGR